MNLLQGRMSPDLEYCRVARQKRDDSPGECIAAEKAGAEEALLLELNPRTSFHNFFDGFLAIGTLGDLDGKCHVISIDPADEDNRNQEKEKERRQVESNASSRPLRYPSSTEPSEKKWASREDVNLVEMNIEFEFYDEEECAAEPLLKASMSAKRDRVTLADLMALENYRESRASSWDDCPMNRIKESRGEERFRGDLTVAQIMRKTLAEISQQTRADGAPASPVQAFAR